MLGSLDGNKNILLLILVLLSFFSIFFSRLSLFERADLYVADALYQKGNVSAGKIVIVQIDEKTLAALGSDPLSWDRKAFAEVLNVLNTKGNEPAVIGVDVLFAHEKDKESDEALVQAAGDNVVLAGMYYYGNKLETGTDGFYVWQKDAVIDEAMPYEGLRKKAETGIVNLTSDKDGKVRHMRIFYPGKEDREASFALAVARRYAAYTGTELVLPEKDHAYLEFTYPAGGYLEKISFIDVKEGKYPASYFAGKIVLIGACAAAMQDEYLTAVDRNRAMYGVEVHANSIEMLLRGEYKTEVNDTLQRTAVLCVLLLGAAVFLFREQLITLLANMRDRAARSVIYLIRMLTRAMGKLFGEDYYETEPDGMPPEQPPEGTFSPLWLVFWIPIILVTWYIWRNLLSEWADVIRDALARLLAILRGKRLKDGVYRIVPDSDEYYDTETTAEKPLSARKQRRKWRQKLHAWKKLPDTQEKFYAGYALLLESPVWEQDELRDSDTVREIRGKWLCHHTPAHALDAVTEAYHTDRYAERGLPAQAVAELTAVLEQLR